MSTSLGLAAEILRDEVHIYSPTQLRYVNGGLEAPVGTWACKRLREIAVQDAEEADDAAQTVVQQAAVQSGKDRQEF